jgi:hypothetical protein
MAESHDYPANGADAALLRLQEFHERALVGLL